MWKFLLLLRCSYRFVEPCQGELKALLDHVLLAFVEPELQKRNSPYGHVDCRGDETVDAHLVVQPVYCTGRVLAAKRKHKSQCYYHVIVLHYYVCLLPQFGCLESNNLSILELV